MKINFLKKDSIYTTGAFLVPVLITRDDGTMYYTWIVDAFEDDSYHDGTYISPAESAYDILELYGENKDDF